MTTFYRYQHADHRGGARIATREGEVEGAWLWLGNLALVALARADPTCAGHVGCELYRGTQTLHVLHHWSLGMSDSPELLLHVPRETARAYGWCATEAEARTDAQACYARAAAALWAAFKEVLP